jgi:anti-sigma regulatory factor (Ser/Thr protein kinase)
LRTEATPHPSGDGMPVAAPTDVVARALHPLIDNAIRHARSPVRVMVVPSHTDVLLRVEDDGDGIALYDIDALFDAGIAPPVTAEAPASAYAWPAPGPFMPRRGRGAGRACRVRHAAAA